MELVHNYQVGYNELLSEKFDCIIAASGCQKRCTYLAEKLNAPDSDKFVIAFHERTRNDLRLENESVFERLGYHSIRAMPDDGDEVAGMVQRLCSRKISRNINVLIDYTCMTKIWYATIVSHLLRHDFQAERINIYFSYTPKKVNGILHKSKLKSFEPLLFENNSKLTDKPVTLVTGMNADHGIIQEFIGQVKPADVYAFIPYFSHDNDYYQGILDGNTNVLKNLPSEKIKKYPAEKPDQISSMLTSLCLDLRLDSNVILVPNGPKTFSLACIMMSVRYPDVRIYDLKLKDEKCETDPGLPAGEPVILKSVFRIEEEEE